MKQIFPIILTLLVFSSCQEEELSLTRENLFSLKIGKMEDQLFVQQFEGVNILSKTRIFMKDGFFFITNGESAKVMEFNSYGDIISLFYNEKENPQPILLSTEKSEDGEITRAAYSFSLLDPGEVVKTNSGDVLVDDLINSQRREYDQQANVQLSRIVYRFNEKGDFVSYIGQEGIGGIPFPFIYGLYSNKNDEITVVCKTSVDWQVFWFNKNSYPLYKIKFNVEHVPMLDNANTLSIESIKPSITERVLYLKIDYYNNTGDGMINFVQSSIVGYNLDSKEYNFNMAVPKNIVKSGQPVVFEKKEQEYLYEFVGVATGPTFFFLGPHEGSYNRLIVVNTEGAVIESALIEFANEEIFFKNYHLSPEGVFSALVCKEYEADIVWWHSDRFIEEVDNDYSRVIPRERN